MEEKKNAGQHRMNRRSFHNNYSSAGYYHVTINVSKELGRPLGRIVGNAREPDGAVHAPRVELTDVGRMVEQELTTSITAHYPMIEVCEHVVMPEHVHVLLAVYATVISPQGQEAHLGQVIDGFKKGCNRRFWEITNQQPVSPQGSAPVSGYKVPSRATTGRTPLFAYGYVDVMPLRDGQLEVQRQYIRNNPRSRLLRSSNRDWLQAKRLSVTTALSLTAMKGYLQRECTPSQCSDTAWQQLQSRLLTVNQPIPATSANGQSTPPKAMVACDSYGNRQLLERRLLPVVCHRKDATLFAQQKERCLAAAKAGAVLVSARIAKGEQAIIDEAISLSLPVILIEDNGFPKVYHPSDLRIDLCAGGRLLLLTPWQYHHRERDVNIDVLMCKAMNCVAQALCKTKDSWWKEV